MILKPAQKICLFLFTINLIYFISSAYITCSNDGSHFALVSAMVEQGTVKINNFVNYTLMVDYAYKDGNYYSDRIPGTAFLSIPFYYLGKLVQETGLGNLLSNHKNISEVFVIFLPNIAGTIVIFLMFKLFMFFKFDFKTSLFSSLIFVFSTLIWFESTHLFSHVLSMVTVFGAVYFVIKMKKFDYVHINHIIYISVLLSLASILEIQNILFIGAFAIYLLLSGKIEIKNIFNKKVLVPLIYGVLVFFVIYSSLLIYNFVAFNELTIKSNKYNPTFPEEKSFLTSLSGNFYTGIDRLFINSLNKEVIFDWFKGTKNKTPGLLVVSPILFISLVGYYYFIKSYKNEALLFLMLILIEVVIVASHRSPKTRHISTILPFLFFPAIFIIKKSFEQRNTTTSIIKRYSLFSLILFLILISAARVFFVHNTYYGMHGPFTFISELPTYIFFYGTLFLIYALFKFIKKFKENYPTEK